MSCTKPLASVFVCNFIQTRVKTVNIQDCNIKNYSSLSNNHIGLMDGYNLQHSKVIKKILIINTNNQMGIHREIIYKSE